jgi:hypothetical protein
MPKKSMMSQVSAQTRTQIVPDARRHTSSTWRDPRLVIGVILVAASVLLGAKLLGDADDTVSVWAAKHDLGAGTVLTARDLVRREVSFPASADADRYVSASSAVARDSTLTRDVGAGELLPRAAMTDRGTGALVEVPISAAAEAIPATVSVGSTVDVWVTPRTAQGEPAGDSVLVLDDVSVVASPRSGTALGPSAVRQLIIGVPDDGGVDLAKVLGQTAAGKVLVTKQG